jgi:hypothetical protein
VTPLRAGLDDPATTVPDNDDDGVGSSDLGSGATEERRLLA